MFFATCLLLSGLNPLPPDKDLVPYFSSPSGSEYAKIKVNGVTILPNGRLLQPEGISAWTGTDLWQVVSSADGKVIIAIYESGFSVFDIKKGAIVLRQTITRKEIAPAGTFSTDGKTFWLSLGDAGQIEAFDSTTFESKGKVNINDANAKHSYVNDFVLHPNAKVMYLVDVATQDIITFDLVKGHAVGRVSSGREPYSAAYDPRTNKLFVANIGLFNYSLIPPTTDPKFQKNVLEKPAFGFPSKEARDGVFTEGRQVPGLGSPYTPDGQSVWSYDLSDPVKPVVSQKVTSGILIHAPADSGKSVGGSAPNEVIINKGNLYVANANNDTVQIFDTKNLKLKRTIKLAPSKLLAKFRGVIPSGMSISPSGDRLYVSESGLNAVAVIRPSDGKVLGHIPTGWFPIQSAIAPDGKTLFVGSQKGLGRGPRVPEEDRAKLNEDDYPQGMPGQLHMIDLTKVDLKITTEKVLRFNGLIPTMRKKGPLFPTQIKHVVFITKENHTFDGIFGELKGARGRPEYAEFGRNGWIREKGKAERVPIMPNHLELAEQFAISDNFYMEPQASGDGHRWLVGVYPSLWTTRLFYAGWDFRRTDEAKGRLVSFGSDGSQIPEDYLENGSIWEHLHRNNLTFRNYGEGYELPASQEPEPTSRTGTYYQVNHPMPKVLFDNTDFNFPAYNTNIPDIARADWFKEDIQKTYRDKGLGLPRFLNIAICNDHGASPRPEWGYPYVSSYMADNDLALGRIVEYLSNTPEWKNMAIFVTQDDSGGDNDHIDRHRSFVLAISPYAKRGYVSNVHTSIISIIRSIYEIFGLGPNNMFDAVTSPLDDMFTDKPDFRPYKYVPVDPRVFKPENTIDPTDPQFKKRRLLPKTKMDDPEIVEALRNRKVGGVR